MRIAVSIAVLTLAIGLARADGVSAGEPSSDELKNIIDEARLVPDNPALDLLGAEKLKVTRPGSVKDLAIELRNLYQDGKLVPEVAIELSPWALTLGRRATYSEYLTKGLHRFLRRLTVSLATKSTGEEEEQVTLGALGIRARIIDDADWRLNRALVECAYKAMEGGLPTPSVELAANPRLEEASLSPEIIKKIEQCIVDHVAWNALQLGVGAAISSSFPQSKLREDLHELVFWGALTAPLSCSSAFRLGGKYLYTDEQVSDGLLDRPVHTLGGTASFEVRNDAFGLLADLGMGARFSHIEDGDGWNIDAIGLVGVEVQYRFSSTWISVRFSAELVDGASELLSLANVKWSYDRTPERSE